MFNSCRLTPENNWLKAKPRRTQMDDPRWLKRGGKDAGKRDTNDTWKCMHCTVRVKPSCRSQKEQASTPEQSPAG
jgi:hypothetical protein